MYYLPRVYNLLVGLLVVAHWSLSLAPLPLALALALSLSLSLSGLSAGAVPPPRSGTLVPACPVAPRYRNGHPPSRQSCAPPAPGSRIDFAPPPPPPSSLAPFPRLPSKFASRLPPQILPISSRLLGLDAVALLPRSTRCFIR
ncbi:hypothetical protein XA68_16726 [Ophiocordyceps unilateralis]|uniref:Uncharacterized protein n=1 Tax=Ophiocordyceps unilateralis TaxID=268505 RepID=A0A2A9P612_OPHUN|nr:hypothetical protein XA68_16726 [Ophiocordyceps unilateralis]